MISSSAPTLEELPAAARTYLDAADVELFYAPYATATWRASANGVGEVFLKAAPFGLHPSLAGEADRCRWLTARGAPVPEVVDHGDDGQVEWLVTRALPGLDATTPQHLDDPERTVPLLAEALRAFHELDPVGCPFDYRVPVALDHAEGRVRRGEVDPSGFHPEHGHLTPDTALDRLRELAPGEGRDLVVTHGDYCLPNVLIDGGRVTGLVDLGEVGLAERWRDLAVATWSLTWNLGPGHEDRFLDAYGTEWDVPRRDFYRLLFDLES
jgi:aminoglycoside phosphotransferase